VEGLLDETLYPEEDRPRSLLLTRRRLVERMAHNLWGESAGHRAALEWDSEWQIAIDAFDTLDFILQHLPPAPPVDVAPETEAN